MNNFDAIPNDQDQSIRAGGDKAMVMNSVLWFVFIVTFLYSFNKAMAKSKWRKNHPEEAEAERRRNRRKLESTVYRNHESLLMYLILNKHRRR